MAQTVRGEIAVEVPIDKCVLIGCFDGMDADVMPWCTLTWWTKDRDERGFYPADAEVRSASVRLADLAPILFPTEPS